MSTEPIANASAPEPNPVVEEVNGEEDDTYDSGADDEDDADFQDGEGDDAEDDEGEEGDDEDAAKGDVRLVIISLLIAQLILIATSCVHRPELDGSPDRREFKYPILFSSPGQAHLLENF